MDRTACTDPQCLYSTAIPLLPLWTVRPVQTLSACTSELHKIIEVLPVEANVWHFECLAQYAGLLTRVSSALTSLHIALTASHCVSYVPHNISLHGVKRLVFIM